MGNVTVTVVKRNVIGGRRVVAADVTFSSSYATNGDTIVAADIAKLLPEAAAGLADVICFDAEMGSDGTSMALDRTNKKIKAFSGRSEVANATNLSVTPGAIRVQFEYNQVNG